MKTVLIVEDERPIREALQTKLSGMGYAVLSAENGQLGLASALEWQPDLILLDQLMPVMDGVTMLEHLRADERGKTLRVLLLTNMSPGSEAIHELDKKFHLARYMVKSEVSLEQLGKTVEELLRMPSEAA